MVRDADLWFTGQSNIPNPKQHRDKPSLGFENRLKRAFTDSGFKTYRSNPPPIPELKQAVDFSIADVFQHKGCGR